MSDIPRDTDMDFSNRFRNPNRKYSRGEDKLLEHFKNSIQTLIDQNPDIMRLLSSKKIADNNEVYREIVGDDGKELLAVIEEEIRAIELAGEEVDIPLLNLKFYLETGIAPD